MLVSTSQLGELLGLSNRHIYNLEKKHILSKDDKDCWDASKNIQAYINYKISIENNGTDGQKARIRRDNADAKLKELLLDEKRGKLIAIEKVAKELEDIAITISNKLYGLPHHLKRGFKMEQALEQALHKEIENILKELKDPNVYTQRALEIEERLDVERELQEEAENE